jgi:hypothetical protein
MLTIRQAAMNFEDSVAEFPMDQINAQPPNCNYTFWHLIEHIRICQQDILEYIESPDYVFPNFPDDLWPDTESAADEVGWQKTISDFLADRRALVEIINDPDRDLFAPLANSGEYAHNILREINIISEHNAYHTGELGILRQTLGLWPAGHV